MHILRPTVELLSTSQTDTLPLRDNGRGSWYLKKRNTKIIHFFISVFVAKQLRGLLRSRRCNETSSKSELWLWIASRKLINRTDQVWGWKFYKRKQEQKQKTKAMIQLQKIIDQSIFDIWGMFTSDINVCMLNTLILGRLLLSVIMHYRLKYRLIILASVNVKLNILKKNEICLLSRTKLRTKLSVE